jgi:hypothetical protein
MAASTVFIVLQGRVKLSKDGKEETRDTLVRARRG